MPSIYVVNGGMVTHLGDMEMNLMTNPGTMGPGMSHVIHGGKPIALMSFPSMCVHMWRVDAIVPVFGPQLPLYPNAAGYPGSFSMLVNGQMVVTNTKVLIKPSLPVVDNTSNLPLGTIVPIPM